MQRSLLLALLVLLALGAGAFLLLADGGDGRGGAPGDLSPVAAQRPAANARDEQALVEPLALAPTGQEKAPTKQAAPTREVARVQRELDAESFDAADAQWVDVDVRLPAGVPIEDEVVLIAFSFDERGNDFGMQWITREVDLGDGYREGTSADAWASRRVQASGVVRTPFSPTAKRGALMIQSRYVYADLVSVNLEKNEPVVVEGELGAFVSGRIVVPAQAGDRTFAPDDFEINLQGRDETSSMFVDGFSDGREVTLNTDLSYEMRALAPTSKYFFLVQAEGLLGYTDMNFSAPPGEHTVHDIEMKLGGTVRGSIRGEDGEPIAEAMVSSSSGGVMFFGNGTNAESAADGTYTLYGVNPGKASIDVSADGWIAPKERTLEIAEGQVVDGVDFVLDRGGVIRGRVEWPDGRPAENARVVARDRQRRGWMSERADAQCDDAGAFLLSGLETGTFEVIATATPQDERASGGEGEPEFQSFPEPEEVDAQTLDALAGLGYVGETNDGRRWRAVATGTTDAAHDLVLVLTEPLTISGRVVDDVGQPVTSFSVRAWPAGGNTWGNDGTQEAFEDPNGAFELSGAFAGEWLVSAEAEGYAPIADDDSVSTLVPSTESVTIVLNRAVSVAGVVLDPSGAPVPGADVSVTTGASSRFGRGGGDETTADENGRFELEDCAPDGLTLVASADGWASSEPLGVAAVPGESHTDLVLTLRVGATITGEVYDAEGNPDSGVAVSAGPVGAGNFGLFGGEDATVTDSAGRFVIEHVEPGTVSVTAMPDQNKIFESLAGASEESQQQLMLDLFGQMRMETIDVADGEEVHVVLGAEPKQPVLVRGRVLERGEPLDGATILVIEEGGSILQGMKMARADDAGEYSVTVDRPGDFMFGVSRTDFGDEPIQYFVSVPETDEYEQDFELPFGAISGVVLGLDGAPLAGVNVRLSQSGGVLGIADLDNSNQLVTDASGAFRFDSLHPGEYRISAGGAGTFFSDGSTRYGAVVVDGIELGKDEEVGGVEIEMAPAGKLKGVVRDERGAPVGRAAIFVRDASGRVLSTLASVTTNGVGEFTYDGLPRGNVTVFARAASRTSADVGPVEISEGQVSKVEITVRPGSFLLVSLLDGDEPVRARVQVLDENGRQVNGMVSEDYVESLLAEGFNSKERRVGPLPPGKYTLRAIAEDGKDTKKTITVSEGQEERRVKLRLK